MFHVSNGLYFERLENGAVRIIRRSGARPTDPVLERIEFSAEDWISIIAAVAAPGREGAEVIKAATRFHHATPDEPAPTPLDRPSPPPPPDDIPF